MTGINYSARMQLKKLDDKDRKWDFKAWWYVVSQCLKGIDTATRLLVGLSRRTTAQDKKLNRRRRARPSQTTRIAMLGPNAECSACGVGWNENEDNLTMDHIIPVAMGGSGHKNNMQVMCESCNQKKGNRIKRFYPADLKVSIGDRLRERYKQ